MRPFGLLLVLTLAAGGLLPARAQMPEMRGGAMLDCSGLPCVDVTLASGKHLKMLIDTGDVSSVLDTQVAKNLGLEVLPVKGADGKQVPGYGRAVLSGLKIGDAGLGDVKVLVMDLAAYMSKDQMPKSDGSLAYTAFKGRMLEMDYVGRKVRFSDLQTGDVQCPGQCGELTTPTFGKHGPPILVATGFSVNGKAITAQIDSLFSGTMLIYPTSVEKLGLVEEARSTKKERIKYTDGGVDMMTSVATAEAFKGRVLAKDATVYFAGPEVHLPDGMFDGTVGHALLEHSVVVMDLKGMRVWLEG
ncbi:retropepsin-like aspartic protease [Acidicapsa acidisoli]|uniref:retropepsin-like aspartic protease n=1 Tax=Acidicapsa acidisoli TaxID=1615681 RepID=UPI0021E0537B|nr:retropepsin-like aspartic protease [Acidicapsa acidisoli]